MNCNLIYTDECDPENCKFCDTDLCNSCDCICEGCNNIECDGVQK